MFNSDHLYSYHDEINLLRVNRAATQTDHVCIYVLYRMLWLECTSLLLIFIKKTCRRGRRVSDRLMYHECAALVQAFCDMKNVPVCPGIRGTC